MLLLPVGHEDTVVRRVPWVSLGIFVVCLGLELHSCAVVPDLEQRAEEVSRQLAVLEARIIQEHLDKQPPSETRSAHDELLEEIAAGGSLRERNEALQGYLSGELGKLDIDELTEPGDPNRERHHALKAELAALEAEVPAIRFGYRPALDGLASMLSSMFAHGGFLHLLGNMWFLYLVGCNLEDRWGRLQFLLFYLVAGCIAALTFTALHPDSEIPLVGASGAVAAAMGAFMVCFSRTKVRMFYAYLLLMTPRWGTFEASAWLVLAAWVGEQALMTSLEIAGSTNVAHSAHAGGFLFGAVVAFLLRRVGVDSQLDAASERAADAGATVWLEHPLYLQAMEQHGGGDHAAAIATLMALHAQEPNHQGSHELLLELGLQHGELRGVDLGLPFLIEHHHRTRAHESLATLYRQLRRALPSYGLTDQELLRIATAAGHANQPTLVVRAVGELLQQHPQSAALPRGLLLAARAQAQLGCADLQRDTLGRLASRFPEHACAGLAREELRVMQESAR